METLPTDYLDGFGFSQDVADSSRQGWGRLFPLGSSFTALDLIDDKQEYTFGRGEDCDFTFTESQNRCFQAYSKVHFKLTKEDTTTGTHVFIHDLSVNGTFVNGEKLGKGHKQLLNNNDEIALALKNNKAYVYMSVGSEDDDLPSALRDNYTLSKLLGRGACGEVKLAFIKGSCKKVAVKIIQKKRFTLVSKADLNTANQVMNEVLILKSLHHPCIIAIEDVIDTADTLYIIMELVEGGELFDRIVTAGHFDEATAKLLFYQIVCGVKYLHDLDISHRDLKPENILLSSDVNETLIKVTDFGLSKFIDGSTMLKTFCGTPNYLAPEVLLSAGTGCYTKAIDCWSLGVILFICLVGYPPFSEDRNDKPLNEQILKGDYLHYMKETQWKSISNDAKDLVKQLMCVDVNKRITLTDVITHAWFQDEEMKCKANKLMYPDKELTTDTTDTTGTELGKRKSDSTDDDTPASSKQKTV